MEWWHMGIGGAVAAFAAALFGASLLGGRSRASSGATLPPIDLSAIPFRPAKWFGQGPATGRRIDWLVIHTSENSETPTTAEAVAAYFSNPISPTTGAAVKVSAHYCVDADSIVQCVRDGDIAWAAPHLNDAGINVELGAFANQTPAQWADAYSEAELTLAARLFATLAAKYSVPLAFVDAAGLLAGTRGITTHAEATKAWKVIGGHQDPGPNFPMDHFLELARSVKT